MPRLVFATVGSLGDLHPVLALALELQRRGHRVEIATSEFYREKICAFGLGFHPLRPEMSLVDETLIRRIMDGTQGTKHLLCEVMMPAVRDMHTDLTRIATGADLLVASELVYAAPLLAAQTGLRWVSFTLAPISLFSIHDPPVPPMPGGGEWLRAFPPFAVRGFVAIGQALTYRWWRPVRQLRRDLGLPPGRDPLLRGKHSPHLDLALFSRVLQSPQLDWPASTVQTGFCFHDEAAAETTLPAAVENFLAAGDAPIVFTLGSAAVYAAKNFYVESARAAQLLGRRALLLLGKNPPPPDLPPSILAWDYLPYAQIFPHAAAIVHQGGVGTTAQALRAGRPMLVMPFAHDQFDNAARMTRLGVAKKISRSCYTAAGAARKLAALLADPRAARLAAEIGGRVRAECGVTAACDALEGQLRPA